MGLTAKSTGVGAIDTGLVIDKGEGGNARVIALAGNPNVGKSTVFNGLTGLNQHTGNWTGKTVSSAVGKHNHKGQEYRIVDLPGTYSLMAHSTEEEVARDFICFGGADVTVVVCDATCLERNMNLVLQTIEITKNVVVCVNLIDEAKKKNIKLDLKQLEKNLGVPVVGTSARSQKGLTKLMDRVGEYSAESGHISEGKSPIHIKYIKGIEQAIEVLQPILEEKLGDKINSRWLALRLLDYDESDNGLENAISEKINIDISADSQIQKGIEKAWEVLNNLEITKESIKDKIISCLVLTAEGVCGDCVVFLDKHCYKRDRKLDKILTSKWTGIPIMLALLGVVLWLTITGANYPSKLLADGLFWFQDRLTDFFAWANAPEWLHGALVLGVYRVLAWVVC